MNLNIEINKIEKDSEGNPNGVILLNKPIGITSHDLVDQTRRKYKTRKVGHAGALDPFASGLMILLIGKSTKLSDEFLGFDKEYEASILLGIETDSGDIEGKIIKMAESEIIVSNEVIENTISSFQPGYDQYVPVLSSVKVKGNKLRQLARSYENFEITDRDNSKFVKFFNKSGKSIELELPRKAIKIKEIELKSVKEVNPENLADNIKSQLSAFGFTKFIVVDIRVLCSKGTYIRQLAIDVGEKLGIPAMLIGLKRTKINGYSLSDVYEEAEV